MPRRVADVVGPQAGKIVLARAAQGAAPLTETAPSTEWLRVKWFLLGVLATGVGVWIGSRL